MKLNYVPSIKFAESCKAGGKLSYEEYLQKNLMFLFLSDLSLLNVKISRAYNKRTRQLYQNSHQYSLWFIMNYKSPNFRDEENQNENVKKSVKVEILLKI